MHGPPIRRKTAESAAPKIRLGILRGGSQENIVSKFPIPVVAYALGSFYR